MTNEEKFKRAENIERQIAKLGLRLYLAEWYQFCEKRELRVELGRLNEEYDKLRN